MPETTVGRSHPRRLRRGLGAALLALAGLLAAPAGASALTESFGFTGSEQTFVVPSGVSAVRVQATGATGTPGASGGRGGGAGARVTGTLSVSPGQTLFVEVGNTGPLPCNGAGPVDLRPQAPGGYGGGAADVRTVSVTDAGGHLCTGFPGETEQSGASLASRLIVAAGGGGGGGGPGGAMGGDAGKAGESVQLETGVFGGQPGTSTSGGASPPGEGAGGDGTLLYGGSGGASCPLDTCLLGGGGGGGAGLYGGGGGNGGATGGGGGGGGSSLVPSGGEITTVAGAPAGVVITACDVAGTDGADRLVGTPAADLICSGGGDDTVNGRGGDDVLLGEAGDDKLTGRAGTDILDGGAGANDISNYDYRATTNVIVDLATGEVSDGLGSLREKVVNVENVVGTPNRINQLFGNAAANRLRGGSRDDFISGHGGNDVILPGAGSNELYAGDGSADEVNYGNLPAKIVARLVDDELDELTTTGAATDVGSGFENLTGTAWGDSLAAVIDGVASVVKGRGGNDLISIADGDGLDTAIGGSDRDFCDGDAGLGDKLNCD